MPEMTATLTETGPGVYQPVGQPMGELSDVRQVQLSRHIPAWDRPGVR
jgi:hypothetical protein